MKCQKCWEREVVKGGKRCKKCLEELSKLCICLVGGKSKENKKI